MTTTLTKNQKKEYSRTFRENGKQRYLKLTIRFDDDCGNGHNSFAMTGDVGKVRKDGSFYDHPYSFGCLHERIAEVFPEFEKYLKWHLCSIDGPMHYIANTIYHASDVDCCGMKKGEFKQFVNKETGLPKWEIHEHPAWKNSPVNSKDCPEPITINYEPYGRTGEGSEPDLDAARKSAIWADATLEQLTNKDLLAERLPGLLKEFQKDVEELGFVW